MKKIEEEQLANNKYSFKDTRNKKACQGVCRADWQWKYEGIQRRQDPCGQANLTPSTGVHWRELERPWHQNSLWKAQRNRRDYIKITKLKELNDQQILGTVVLIHIETHNKVQIFFHGISWELDSYRPISLTSIQISIDHYEELN